MVYSEYSPENCKYSKRGIGAVIKILDMIGFIPYHLKSIKIV